MKNHQKETFQKVENHSYQEYFLQDFEVCSRVSFFNLNRRDNERASE